MKVTHDKKLLIAFGRSRRTSIWKNKEILWSEFLDKLATTTRTRETVVEYAAMTKAERDTVKDVGGFVGGYLKNGRRSNASVVNRCLVCLDIDYADEGIYDDLDMTFINAYALYSTHSHTPEKMRLRLIIPLTRTVTPDEYAAIARRLADDLTLSRFDPTTFEPSRLMYWPSTSDDGEFVFRFSDESFLDPDVVLATYADWRDASLWPTTKPLEERVRANAGKQEDPLTKRGIVGAFCRAHSITDVLENILREKYTPTAFDDRYTFVGGSTTGGLVIYGDKHAYSHHATDPASGHLCNAFDLVRLHLFTPGIGEIPDERASMKAMQEYAANDEAIKRQLSDERLQQAAEDFSDTEEDPDWQQKLELDKAGNVKDTLDNLVLILKHDPKLRGIAFNRHRDGIDAKEPLPWGQIKAGWNDSDNAALKVYLSGVYSLYSPTKTKDAVLAVAASRSYHPIEEYLEGLPAWDRTERVETLLTDYFGAADSGYTRAVMRKTLVAAVARIYRPGTKFDSVLILNGPQGIGKSTFFSKLAGDWFSDSLTLTEMRDKTGAEKLQGFWLLELGELAGMRKADVETVKSFISRMDDKYRASYGFNVENHPRQCVIVGSTNSETGFLRDITGNRRFWPVSVTGECDKKPWSLNQAEVDQIWAESLSLYRAGERLYLEGEDAQAAQDSQRDALETDEREGLVRAYLERLLPEQWDEMGLFERRNFLNGSEFGGAIHSGTMPRKRVCNMEIWCECLGKDASTIKKSDSYELAAMLRRIGGWAKSIKAGGLMQFPIYGKQRAYIREQP